jgi:hypothetical protein
MHEESLGVDRRHAAAPRSAHRLTVGWISDIAGREHSGDICLCASRFRNEISNGIHIQDALEQFRVWVMTNRKEEPIAVEICRGAGFEIF